MPQTHYLSKPRLCLQLEGPQRGVGVKKKRKWEAKLFNLSCPHAQAPQHRVTILGSVDPPPLWAAPMSNVQHFIMNGHRPEIQQHSHDSCPWDR